MTLPIDPPTHTGAKKPLRFKIGIALFIICGLLYLGILVSLYLPLPTATRAAAIAGTVVAAEICFYLGAVLVGKEAMQALKSRLHFRRRASGSEYPPAVE